MNYKTSTQPQKQRKAWRNDLPVNEPSDKGTRWVFTTDVLGSELEHMEQMLSKATARLQIMTLYHDASHLTGGCVHITTEYKGLAIIPRPNDNPVFLYEFIEVLDEVVDYDDIISKLPGLDYSQIYGVLMFLRKIAQFNTSDVDIDDLEQRALAQDPEFVKELRAALNDREKTRVLSPS